MSNPAIEQLGLSSERAFEILFNEAKSIIAEWYSLNVVNKLIPQTPNKIRTFSRFFCTRTFIYIVITLIFLIIGSVDINNHIVVPSVVIYFLLLIFTFVLYIWQNRVRANIFQHKYRKAYEEIEKLQNHKISDYVYQTNLEPVTDDVTIWQACIRDGKIVEVPRILLVQGDIIVFRPGQISPCECETFDGRFLNKGDKIDWIIKKDENTNIIEPLEPIHARVVSFPIKYHLETTLSSEDSCLQFDYQLQFIIHKVFERYIIPIVFIFAIIGSIIRLYYPEKYSFYSTRFIFAIPCFTILPLFTIQLPILLHFVKFWNNRLIAKELGIQNYSNFESTKDLVSVFSSITGASIIDKKGVLSAEHPSIEKLVFATKNTSDDCYFEVINLSSEQNSQNPSIWNLSMDDLNWKRFTPSLLPLGHNILLNSCKQNQYFHKLLDHLSVVALNVPRTIATANRRCMCQLPILMGFTDKSIENFNKKPSKVIGIYKKQPGEAPLPGLTKHRTPLEMAFCTIHEDSNSLYSHFSCQGTANIVVDACTHIWNGKNVIPMSKRMISATRDFYQRHSMTGHCLAISYRPVFSKIDPSVNGKFIEIPLNREINKIEPIIPKHHSTEFINEIPIQKTIRTSDELIEECFTGNILCGLVVLHYEAIQQAVTMIEKLDSLCVRPVYFSKENELRSRVFAEKLGIEAGWNCHISLADEEIQSKQLEINYEQFANQKPSQPKFWKRFALSESHLESLDCESLLRGSPSTRKMSVVSPKVGPIPNIARLPTGIQNVRPHLDEVDNVPLLVGLFTDSTTPAVEEMFDILQENGEIIIAIGSSRNVNNTKLFTKSNISICVDDLEEKPCRINENEIIKSNVNEISSQLLSLATDFRLDHKQLLKIPWLINCSRHRMLSFRHSFIFLLYSSLLLSITILISMYLLLPIIFTHAQIIISTLIHIPILFIGTIFTKFEPKSNIIRIAPKNSEQMSKIEKTKLITTFLMQFIPTTIYLNILFMFLINYSKDLCTESCDNGNIEDEPTSYDIGRHIIGFHFTTCLCVLSSSFVYGLRTIWNSPPFECLSWIIAVSICMISQIGYSFARSIDISKVFLWLPSTVLFLWIIAIVIINELIKIRRIRQFTQEQRRTKFDFDTKLGMNSPY